MRRCSKVVWLVALHEESLAGFLERGSAQNQNWERTFLCKALAGAITLSRRKTSVPNKPESF